MTKILLVEDDKSLREIYGVRLLAEGYDIVSAGDGEEALAMAIKEKPELIVSDVMMPKISGFDMLDILRSTTETKNIKVIMMTALSSEDQRQRGEQLGADRYLVKSQVGIEDVVRTVHEVLADIPGVGAQPVATPLAIPTTPTVPAGPAPMITPTPSPQPVAPAPPTVLAAPAPSPVANPLPQPTAPFSTPRPGNLSSRVIHPLERESIDQPDIAERINQELNSQAPPTPPVIPPMSPSPPSGAVSSAQLHDLNFEETPHTPSPSTPTPPPFPPQ